MALRDLDIRQSVGRTGICYDNAMAESFFAALKTERVHRTEYPTRHGCYQSQPIMMSTWVKSPQLDIEAGAWYPLPGVAA
jgi:putative transposase